MNVYDENAYGELVRNGFSSDVLRQAVAASGIRPSSLLSNRLDLRGKTILSFGEQGDKYCECAVSVYRNGGGSWQLGLHISDVDEYVCEGSPLDEDARMRRGAVRNGFVNADMLPPAIAHDVCDLRVGKDRLALSVIMDVGADGTLKNVSFEESVIRVAEKCLYDELDQLGIAKDASSVITLREKYAPYLNILLDMFELAAIFCAKRRERGGLDCAVFRRSFVRDGNGDIEFSYKQEPDSRAMVRELGYFAAEAVGRFLDEHSLPCIYVGQDTLDETALDFLGALVGETDKAAEGYKRAADIADLAKGSPYYGFVCTAIRRALPCVRFSDKPIFNSVAATDHLVSFIHPVTKYSSLLTIRMIKNCILASGDPNNININKYRKMASVAAERANDAENFIYTTQKRYFLDSAYEYIGNNVGTQHVGFPIALHEGGGASLMLICGLIATISAEYAKGFDLAVGTPCRVEVIALGTDEEPAVVKPVK